MTTKNHETAAAVVQNEGAPVVAGTAAALDTSPAADIAPATAFTPAGAPDQVTDIDIDHPAVDNDPRAGTTADQNRIDFNDPGASSAETVAKNLKDQAKA